MAMFNVPDKTHGIAIYAYIDPQNHPNVGVYGSPMERLGVDDGPETRVVAQIFSH